jgi:hypothetical protein
MVARVPARPPNVPLHSTNGSKPGCPLQKPLNPQGKTSHRKMNGFHQGVYPGVDKTCNRETTDYAYLKKKSNRNFLLKVFFSNRVSFYGIPCLWIRDAMAIRLLAEMI